MQNNPLPLFPRDEELICSQLAIGMLSLESLRAGVNRIEMSIFFKAHKT